jgi:hypothetical protein
MTPHLKMYFESSIEDGLKCTTLLIQAFMIIFYINILMTEKIFRFRQKEFMPSPARKKNIALLNLSSQCIVFMEKCISVPRVRKQIFY